MDTRYTDMSKGISSLGKTAKRLFDILISLLGLLAFCWLIVLAYILASFETKQGGFFRQVRIGQYGEPFKVIKIRTMRNDLRFNSTVTTAHDPRITYFGRFFRKTKIDELPQLINVLIGEMSLVGPRPDVPGYSDGLGGDDRVILTVKPGITGPASLKYRNEEKILAAQVDPERYNREIIFPDKVKINKEYVLNYSFRRDIQYMWETIFGGGRVSQ
jgi:lipopolysaccharide/colanic/teichoic acid biosynthesis glycosyltransferase